MSYTVHRMTEEDWLLIARALDHYASVSPLPADTGNAKILAEAIRIGTPRYRREAVSPQSERSS